MTANVAPKAVSLAYQSALAGKTEQARALDLPLQALHRDLFVEANPIPVKWALHRMGYIDLGIRLPLTVLSDSKRPLIEAALQQAHCLANS